VTNCYGNNYRSSFEYNNYIASDDYAIQVAYSKAVSLAADGGVLFAYCARLCAIIC
jgi:hypothetical protein